MVDYQKLYLHLVGKVSDIIDSMEGSAAAPYEKVRTLLIQAIQEAEEEYLEQGE